MATQTRVFASSPQSPSFPPSVPHVAIVGGGMAGLSAASRLSELQIPNTVFDMGTRVPGGRACSRIIQATTGDHAEDLSFDHGAQFLAPVGKAFSAQVQKWITAGIAAPWIGRFGALNAESHEFIPVSEVEHLARPKESAGFCGMLAFLSTSVDRNEVERRNGLVVGVPSMGSLAQHIVAEMKHGPRGTEEGGAAIGHLKIGHKVTAANWDAQRRQWHLEGVPRSAAAATPVSFGSFDALVIADALIALPDSAGYVEGFTKGHEEVKNIVEAIQNVQHESIFSLMVAFEKHVDTEAVPFDAASVLSFDNDTLNTLHQERDGSRSLSTTQDAAGSGVEAQGGNMQQLRGGAVGSAFQWVARNSSKPGRLSRISPSETEASSHEDMECWVAVTTPEKAKELLQRWPLHTAKGAYNPQTAEYRDEVAKELQREFLELLLNVAHRTAADKMKDTPGGKLPQLPKVVYCHAQRWGRAFVMHPNMSKDLSVGKSGSGSSLHHRVLFLGSEDAKFAACGDFVSCGNTAEEGGVTPLENAWCSGRRAAESVAAWLSK